MSDRLDEWQRRLGRAAALLTARLDAPPSLAELAGAAAVSPFHFHRIWRGLTGETVGQTVARLRIEAAKAVLAASDGSVTEAAMAAGFATPQSFARAFRRQTGISPSGYRAQPVAAPPSAGGPVELVLCEATRVVALRLTGHPYRALDASFGVVWGWANRAGLIDGLTGIYGVPWDDPASVAVAELRYDAALGLGDVISPAPFAPLVLAGGPYARLRHVGSYDVLEAVDQWLVGEWLPRSGREPADAPLFHHFLSDPEHVAEADLLTDVLLPLVPDEEMA